ncbi:MAG: PAS domain-containing protein, partial [Bacteroidota bacterium]
TTELKEKEAEQKNNLDQLYNTQLETRKKQIELESLKSSLELKVKERTLALKDALDRFDLIVQSTSEGLWDMQLPLNQAQAIGWDSPVNWSSNLKKIFAYSEEVFSDNLGSWLDKVHPEEQNKLQALLQSALDKNTEEELEVKDQYRFLSPDQEYLWFEIGFKTRTYTSKNLIRLAGYHKLINDSRQLQTVLHDLKRNQLALEESNKKYQSNSIILRKALGRAREKEIELRELSRKFSSQEAKLDNIIRNVPGVVFQISYHPRRKELKLLYVSDYARIILEKEEVFSPHKNFGGEPIFEILGIEPADQPLLQKLFLASQKNLSPFKWEGKAFIGPQKNKWKWLRINAFPRLNKSGKLVLYEGIISDRSAQKNKKKN